MAQKTRPPELLEECGAAAPMMWAAIVHLSRAGATKGHHFAGENLKKSPQE
jgi:hypothetical protein